MIKQDIENLIKIKEENIKECEETIKRHTRAMMKEKEYVEEEKARLIELASDCKELKKILEIL